VVAVVGKEDFGDDNKGKKNDYFYFFPTSKKGTVLHDREGRGSKK
jgi:hypothetical protein